MLDEFKQSVNKIMNERLTSPFWGALIFSWLIWNWKIVYLTVFIDQDKIAGNKIDFIMDHYYNIWYILILPVISTLFLTTLFPYATNWLYQVSIKFNKKKTDIKNRVEGASLLSLEKSIQIREEIKNIHKKYEDLTKDSEEEIKILNAEINALKDSIAEKETTYNSTLEENESFRNVVTKHVKEIDSLHHEKVKLEQQVDYLTKELETHFTDEETEIAKIAEKVFTKINDNELHALFKAIDENLYLSADRESIERLLHYGILEKDKKHGTDKNSFTFKYTIGGEKVKNIFYQDRY